MMRVVATLRVATQSSMPSDAAMPINAPAPLRRGLVRVGRPQGKVGAWSKTDSVSCFDEYTVTQAP